MLEEEEAIFREPRGEGEAEAITFLRTPGTVNLSNATKYYLH